MPRWGTAIKHAKPIPWEGLGWVKNFQQNIMATPDFKYAPMFQLGKDDTEYYLLTKDGANSRANLSSK